MTSPSPSEPRTPKVYHAVVSPAVALLLVIGYLAVMISVGGGLYLLGVPALLATGAGQLVAAALLLVVNSNRGGTPATVGLARPTARHVAAAALIGCGIWYLDLLVTLWLHAPTTSPGLARAAEQLPLAPTLLAISILPGVCEELMFRGVLLRALAARMPAALAVVASAVVFGAYHMNRTQLLPASLLGLALGFVTLRARSIVPAMLLHVLNNTIVILVFRDALGVSAALDHHPTLLLAGAALAVAGGLALAARPAPPGEAGDIAA